MNRHFPPDPLTLSQAIQFTVSYADIFDYPMTAEEIHRYLIQFAANPVEVVEALQFSSALAKVRDYYMLPGRENLADIRLQRDLASVQLWEQAARYGLAITRLPFIRMVAVTGSLAMNNTDLAQGADIDFLIVTAPGRLWSTRALLLLFVRRAALAGVSLCPNYLVTTQALAFPDHNLYAAHEVAQMIPLSGLDYYAEIRWKNTWVDQFLPNAENYPRRLDTIRKSSGDSPFRTLVEMMMQTPPGTWIERMEMERKIRKLTWQQSGSLESTFSADVCKGHANRHAAQSQAAFIERLRSLSLEVET